MAIRSFRDRNPYMIGLGSVVILFLMVAFAFSVGAFHLLEHTYSIRAEFSDAAGIKKGDTVRVAGVRVGRVSKVEADRLRGRVIVSLVVNDGVRLGPEERAEVALETLLGTKNVRLTGPVHAPYMNDMPKAARLIPIERTKTPFDVFELTKVSTRSIQATDTEKLNKLIIQLANVTEGKHEQISDLLNGITQVSGAINARDAQLRELLDRADQLSGTLADKDQTLVSLIDQSQGVLDLVARRKGDIAAGLRSSNQAVGELAGVIQRNETTLDAILTTLHPTIDTVERHQSDLDRALTVVGPGALGLGRAAAHGPWADVYVRDVGPSFVCLIAQTTGGSCPVDQP